MKIKKLINWRGILSILSLLFGLVFYLLWSIAYNSWTDISSYSVAVPFIALGILGILISLSD